MHKNINYLYHYSPYTVYTPDGSRTLIGAIPDSGYHIHSNELESEVQGPKEKSTYVSASTQSMSHYNLPDVPDSRDGGSRDSRGVIRGRGKEGEREMDRGGDKGKEKDRELDRERERKDRVREKEREKDREREREAETEWGTNSSIIVEKGISFDVYEGDRVLIAGPSGTGKSSLLRAIAGLWELGSGKIIWNTSANVDTCRVKAPQGVFFLPQKPYNVLGSLRQQISYPEICPDGMTDRVPFGMHSIISNPMHSGDDDVDLLELLRLVRLDTLAVRMGAGDELAGHGSGLSLIK